MLNPKSSIISSGRELEERVQDDICFVRGSGGREGMACWSRWLGSLLLSLLSSHLLRQPPPYPPPCTHPTPLLTAQLHTLQCEPRQEMWGWTGSRVLKGHEMPQSEHRSAPFSGGSTQAGVGGWIQDRKVLITTTQGIGAKQKALGIKKGKMTKSWSGKTSKAVKKIRWAIRGTWSASDGNGGYCNSYTFPFRLFPQTTQ